MSDVVENLILDLIEWASDKEQTYEEAMNAWRTSCPGLPVWEDANDRGFIAVAIADGRSLVRATPEGLAFLALHRNRPLMSPGDNRR